MLFKKRKFLRVKNEIQTMDTDNGHDWFFNELESIRLSVMHNNGMNYSPRVEERNIERLQQLVWWLEDERKNHRM
jgi:hypothetical protein